MICLINLYAAAALTPAIWRTLFALASGCLAIAATILSFALGLATPTSFIAL